MSGRVDNQKPVELKKRLGTLTDELMELHRELYWLAQDQDLPAQEQKLGDLNFDQVMGLKLAVDNLREILWTYLDAVAKLEPEKVHDAMDTHRLRRVTQLLDLLRQRLSHADASPVSFIERISAAIKEKLKGSGGKAA